MNASREENRTCNFWSADAVGHVAICSATVRLMISSTHFSIGTSPAVVICFPFLLYVITFITINREINTMRSGQSPQQDAITAHLPHGHRALTIASQPRGPHPGPVSQTFRPTKPTVIRFVVGIVSPSLHGENHLPP
jgi:hypothetical protein